ncbi:hypothetical protein XA68_14118 [Ophiocordyceps unilateralis]|uniref:Uncharacterized protein n=1 Tax=Ophiocordyceps unilateralis TaxID=268505 RepID=A0A2A9PA01_OPHUN|nr:hypothetical protein XA68_14118 [Ophiocordyceps unilateralis]
MLVLASATISSSTSPAKRTAIVPPTALVLKSPLKRNANAVASSYTSRPAQHGKLLGIGFLAKKVPKGKTSSDSKDVTNGPVAVGDHAARAAMLLSEPCVAGARWHAGRVTLFGPTLALLSAQSSMSSPSIYFDGRRYDSRIPAIPLLTSDSNTASLAYMNLDTLQSTRSDHLYRKKFRTCFYNPVLRQARVNDPVSRLIQKMLRRLQPQKRDGRSMHRGGSYFTRATAVFGAETTFRKSGALSQPRGQSHDRNGSGQRAKAESPEQFQGSCHGDVLHGDLLKPLEAHP